MIERVLEALEAASRQLVDLVGHERLLPGRHVGLGARAIVLPRFARYR